MNAVLIIAGLCAAQTPTQLALTVAPSLDVDYSDAVLASVTLTETGGAGVADARIDFFVRYDDEQISFSPGSLPATGADGSAGPLRVRFVEGAYGVDHMVAADPDGAPYVLEARFGGSATHAASQASVTLRLHREAVALQLLPEYAGRLGDVIDFVATLVDGNGDVDESGQETSGRIEKPIAGATVTFYIDLNTDGDFVDPDEGLGQAVTGGNGVARVELDTTPIMGLPRAGLHPDALRVEFSGDERYKVTAGLGDLRLEAAAVDPARCLLAAMPPETPADGFSRVAMEATLIDVFGNPLGPDDDLHQVRLESSAGKLLAEPTRDATTGRYTQELEAPRAPQEATVTLYVDEVESVTAEVVFLDAGCGCGAAPRSRAVGLGLLFGLLVLRRGRASRRTL